MWDIRQKATNEQSRQTDKKQQKTSHRYGQQDGGYQKGMGLGEKRVKGIKYMMTKEH